jgi:uncharacterized protein
MSVEKTAVLAEVEAWVRERLDGSGSVAHGWPHTDRVRNHILVLARAEGVDPFLAELAALLHDVGRSQPGPEKKHGDRSAAMAGPLLAELPLSDDEREAVLHAVRWHNSARGDTRLLLVLRDADMLDGLGAIGIMRAFRSRTHLPAYDPDAPFEDSGGRWPPTYASDQLLGQMAWINYLNTGTARQMAEERYAFMKRFADQVRREIVIVEE